VLSDLGWAYNIDCQFEKSIERIEEGTLIWRELGNGPMLSNSLNLTLFNFFWTGQDESVLRVAEENYQISSSINEVWNQASARYFQGLVWFDYGEIDRALPALEESVRLAAQGNPVYEYWYNAILWQAYGELGAADLVKDLFCTQRKANQDVPQTPVRTGTLIAYALFELTSGQLDAAAATLLACNPDAAPWEATLHMSKCRLALARTDFKTGAALADEAVAIIRQKKLGQYLPEALYLKGKAHFMLGDLQEAKIELEQARTAAEKLGSRRLLWPIIANLAELETDKTLSGALKEEAREIVQYIAGHIARENLRESFLQFAAAGANLS
jgi:tetratricopeptide (TPR) repeat protein